MISTILKYRILFYALAVSLLLGSWEVIALHYLQKDAAQYRQQVEKRNYYQGPEHSLSRTLNRLYPKSADSLFMRGVSTGFKNNHFLSGCQFFKEATATGARHNEDLFQKITICLERENADDKTIQQAVDRWRQNFPHGQKPYFMRFQGFNGRFPDKAAEKALKSNPHVQYLGIQLGDVQYDGIQTGDVAFRLSGSKVDIRAIRDSLEQAGFISHE